MTLGHIYFYLLMAIIPKIIIWVNLRGDCALKLLEYYDLRSYLFLLYFFMDISPEIIIWVILRGDFSLQFLE